MALRVCAEAGCPELVDSGRCTIHRRQRERARGTREQRGYDYAHKQQRRRWIPKVAAGTTTCARCGLRISPLEDWHLDHTDDRLGYLGPSHVACNTSAPHKG